jgi:hypothetical protein
MNSETCFPLNEGAFDDPGAGIGTPNIAEGEVFEIS